MTYHDLIGTHYLQDINQDYLYQDVAGYNQKVMGPAHVENVLHLTCHHKALFDADAERKVLETMGLELESPAAGCCGHAGSFGYEALSRQIGELALLPAVRNARQRLIIADGFSCRQQAER